MVSYTDVYAGENEAQQKASSLRSGASGPILATGLVLGLCVDVLFYGKPLGISVLIMTLLIVGALFVMGRIQGVPPARRNLWLLVPMVFFAGMVFVRANSFLTFLNVVAVLALLCLVAYFYAGSRVERLGLLGYPIVLLLAGLNILFQAATLISAGIGVRASRKPGSYKLLVSMLRGLLLALPVLFVFTGLLASADLIFANFLRGLVQFDATALADVTMQIAIVLVSAWLLAGGLFFALTRGHSLNGEEAWDEAMETVPTVLHIGFVEATTLLLLVDLLFLVFGWIQFAYLFGGASNISVEGLTYADYARRGFFELIAVSVLTLGLILGLHHVALRDIGKQARIFTCMCTLMVALVLVLLASAFRRMQLYEDAYGYTELRLYVHAFEVWLGITFVWLGIVLWFRPRHFAVGAFVAAIGFLVTLNVINPEALIVQENLNLYRSTGKTDITYLTTLSEDATSTLVAALDTLSASDQSTMRDHLSSQLRDLETSTGWQSWPSWQLARSEAYSSLQQNRAKLVGK